MKYSVILIFCLTILAQKILCQSSPALKLIGEVKGEFVYIKPDILGNLFAFTATGQLKKFNSSLDSTGVFNEVKRYGALHQISSDNPLRTLLYFKTFRIILILDRFMQVINKIDLRNAAVFQVNSVAQSYDNKVWLFDEQDARLKKLNELGKLEIETGDIRLLAGINPSPEVIFEIDKYVCMYDSQHGLVLFDQLGGYRNTIPLTGWSNVHGIGDYVLGMKDKKLVGYNFKNKQSSELLDLSGAESQHDEKVVVCGQRLFILGRYGVRIYHLPT
jgi:hypothetical protein